MPISPGSRVDEPAHAVALAPNRPDEPGKKFRTISLSEIPKEPRSGWAAPNQPANKNSPRLEPTVARVHPSKTMRDAPASMRLNCLFRRRAAARPFFAAAFCFAVAIGQYLRVCRYGGRVRVCKVILRRYITPKRLDE